MAKVNPIQVAKFLKGVNYPASKADLVKQAEKNRADEQVRSALTQLPDEQFGSPADVSKAIGQLNRRG